MDPKLEARVAEALKRCDEIGFDTNDALIRDLAAALKARDAVEPACFGVIDDGIFVDAFLTREEANELVNEEAELDGNSRAAGYETDGTMVVRPLYLHPIPPPSSDARDAAPSSRAQVDVLAERRRQTEVVGYDSWHDDEHDDRAIAMAAACCAADNAHLTDLTTGKPIWPADWLWKTRTLRNQLVVAGALILAEIERLDRAALAQEKGR